MIVPIVVAYLAMLVVLVCVDLVWLGVVAKPVYQQAIGHLMAAKPFLPAAVVFYLIYPVGLLVFAIAPDGIAQTWTSALTKAAMFGFFAYATYELTSLAVMRDWPVGIVVVDIAWGTALSALAAVAGKLAWDAVS